MDSNKFFFYMQKNDWSFKHKSSQMKQWRKEKTLLFCIIFLTAINFFFDPTQKGKNVPALRDSTMPGNYCRVQNVGSTYSS